MQFDQRSPVYLQVVRWFKQRIATEELQSGQEIPSRREIAAQLGINPNTAQKAYKEMEEQQLITTERNVPSKITRDRCLKSMAYKRSTEKNQSFKASRFPFQWIN
ncbi:GntR family transcriptional regulator [Exiguobacterium sp.]|uniref:GntR family transcriptional regulator n=1 Tax=Exiguobacterium sp. TaxID=44751 RepID=UPI0028ACE6DB|nr:GntR family transcriptional regulator [Exiguobacterium sp.]